MRISRLLATVAIAMMLPGCGGGSAPAPLAPAAAPGPVAQPPRPTPAAQPKEPEAGPPLPPMAYDAKQRRDPFGPLRVAEGSKGLSVGSVKLVGIVDGRQAHLALVEAPDGIGYILKTGDVLGDGRVININAGSVTFAVAARAGQVANSLTLRLRTE